MNASSSRSRLRFLSALLVAAALFTGGVFVLPRAAFAEGASEEGKTYSVDAPPALSSTHALLVEEETDTVLFEAGADEKCYPASLTKVMTAIVVLDNAGLDDMVTVEEGDFDELTWDSSVAGLKAGETLSVRDLLACLLLPSGNEAAYVLARHVGGGDWHAFVDLMNDRAAELGCTGTHFANPCGLHDDDHYTTPRDLVTIFEAALAYPEFVEISGSATWDLPATSENPARTLENTDALVDPESPVYMDGIIGPSKTGTTTEGGRCLIAQASSEGRTLVCVVLGAPMDPDAQGITQNIYDVRSLVEWGFGAWRTGEVVSVGDTLATVDVELSSDGDEVSAEATSAVVATVPADVTLEDLTLTPSWDGSFQAPLEEGSELGEVSVAYGDRELGTVAVSPARTMALSIPSFLIWWLTSDVTHAIIVVVVAVALFVGIGLLCNSRARARRRREQRLKVSAARAYATSPRSSYDKGGRLRSSSRGSGPAHGTGRHMRQ